MSRNVRWAMAAMFGLALTAAVSFQAAAQEDPMQEDVMQSEPAVAEDFGKDCGKGCCDDCCCGSIYGDFQFLYLEAYATEEAFDDDVDEEEGYRINVGYTGCDGMGLRVRYFDYDGLQTVEDDNDESGLDLDYWDVEVTDTICICNLHGLVSAGYRHANYEVHDDGAEVDFEGDGVTLGVTLEREISCNLGAFAWAQHSILFGDDDEGDYEDTLMNWTEVQLGAQYATCVAGYNAVIRGGVEVQSHEGQSDTDTQDTGLFGWFVSAGVDF